MSLLMALQFVESCPCNKYLILIPKILTPRSPIIYFPIDEQWLLSILLNFGFSLVLSDSQGALPQP